MTENTKRHSVERRSHETDDDGAAYFGTWRIRALLPVMLLGSFVALGVADAKAQTADVAYGKCQLSPTTIASLKTDMENPAGGNKIELSDVDFVVVYRMDKSNWGQPIKSDGTTARVLCAAGDLTVTETSENTKFPSSGTVDIVNADETLAVRVQGAAVNGIATRICLASKAADSNPVTCFDVVPSP
jgi:hypothetical protein